MKILRPIWIILGLSFVLFSKAYAGWAITYGKDSCDYKAMSVDLTQDGGYVVTGYSLGPTNAVLMKVNSKGSISWTKTYSYWDDLGNHCLCYGFCGRQTKDGGYIVCGTRNWDGSVNFDLWLMKTDGEGNVVWEKLYGRPPSVSVNIGYSVKEVSAGGYIVAGEAYKDHENGGHSDIWLLRVDENGDTLWTDGFESQYVLPSEFGWDVLETPDGGFVLTGSREENLCLIKTNSSGDTVLSRIYEFEHAMDAAGRGLALCPDGGYLMALEMDRVDAPLFCSDIWLFKVDSNGDSVWMKRYGEEKLDERPSSLKRTRDGGYVIVGYQGTSTLDGGVNMDMWFLKTDSLGDTLWTYKYGGTGNDYGRCVLETPDGGYIMAGYTNSFGSGFYEYWLIKTDSLGLIGITEPPVTHPPSPVTHLEIANPIGSEISLRYFDCPNGFHAFIFDASGSRIDEIRLPQTQGTITWGGERSGVYFIKIISDPCPHKIVLIK